MFTKKFLFLAIFSLALFGALFSFSYAVTKEEQEAIWREELAATEKEIAEWQAVLSQTKKGTASLEKDAAVLNAKIKEAQAFIRQRNIAIEQLGRDIDQKTNTINDLEQKIEQGHDSLAQLIRKTNEIDSYSLPEIILANRNISEFFSDIDSFNSIKRSMRDLFVEIRQNKDLTQAEKEALAIKKNKEADTKATIEAQKREVEKNEKEKQYLIKVNKTQEKTYAQVLAERQKKAAEIRAALFSLRDSSAIPFGDALTYAEFASEKTGVRPALILAILQQESNLGQNVGTCNRAGDPASKSWKVIMPGPEDKASGKSRRDDQSIFVQITTELGIPQDGTPLSCPWGGGWGGAMGPSQFIPSTWLLFKSKIATALGVSAPDPWNPKHAVMATAIYMGELGADSGGYTAERNAACRYYSGRACDNKTPSNTFYGNQVMSRATNIQETMIDPLRNL
ncbi:MAG: lytic murein transglycosylase [Candidatus Paceibacterota bacterium]